MDKIQLLKQMVEEQPTHGNSWYLLGIEYIDQNRPSEALQAFSEALKYCDTEMHQEIFAQLASLSKPETDTGDGAQNKITRSSEPKPNDQGDAVLESDSTTPPPPFKVIDGGQDRKVLPFPEPKEIQVTFDDVGGLSDLKKTIEMKIIKPFTNPGIFSRFKKKVGGGILLYGPPGCGKSFMAKATAGECGAHFNAVHITDILDPYIGVSEKNIHHIFTTARSHKPCILFFDEIDALGYNRSKMNSNHLRPTIDQLLTEIDGIDSNTDQLLIMAATNMPWDVDPAFKRPGRFDKLIFVAPPDEAARQVIFSLKLKDKPVDEVDLHLLARKTDLYSGADIENVIDLATEHVLDEIFQSGVERPIQMQDLLQAIEMTKPSTMEWLQTIKNYVKYSNQSGVYSDVDKYLRQYKKLL